MNDTTASSCDERVRYWNAVARLLVEDHADALWRAHSDAVNVTLIGHWLPDNSTGSLLKTDLFDEALGQGLYPLLASRAKRVVGVDLAVPILDAASSRYPKLLAMWADVRFLPFSDGAFDIIVSNSTLDHFDSMADLVGSLRELQRVLRPGSDLLLTIDNLANPIIGLRNRLPFKLLKRLGLLSYQVGATCGPRRLRRILTELGFEVLEMNALLHCPRILAVKLARILKKHGNCVTQQRFLRHLMAFEHLARWPTRFLTGYFIAVRARKSSGPRVSGKQSGF